MNRTSSVNSPRHPSSSEGSRRRRPAPRPPVRTSLLPSIVRANIASRPMVVQGHGDAPTGERGHVLSSRRKVLPYLCKATPLTFGTAKTHARRVNCVASGTGDQPVLFARGGHRGRVDVGPRHRFRRCPSHPCIYHLPKLDKGEQIVGHWTRWTPSSAPRSGPKADRGCCAARPGCWWLSARGEPRGRSISSAPRQDGGHRGFDYQSHECLLLVRRSSREFLEQRR